MNFAHNGFVITLFIIIKLLISEQANASFDFIILFIFSLGQFLCVWLLEVHCIYSLQAVSF